MTDAAAPVLAGSPPPLTLDHGVYANLARFVTGDARGHVESFFVKANDPVAPRAIWLRFTCRSPVHHPEAAVAETWAIWFDATGERPKVSAVKQTFPAAGARFARERFSVRISGCLLEDDRTDGVCSNDGHAIGWDLRFTTDRAPFLPLPYEAMYTGPFPRSKTTTPHPASLFSGKVRVDGETVRLVHWPGCQGHNWGRSHAASHAWLQCCAFKDAPGSWFEAIAGRVRVAGFTTPMLTLARLVHDGRTYDFTRLQDLRQEVRADGTRFFYQARRGEVALRAEFDAPLDTFAALGYEDPDGSRPTVANSMLASGRVQVKGPDGKATLVAERTACFERLDRTDALGIKPLL